jgi:GT2 family glycosyltransferase
MTDCTASRPGFSLVLATVGRTDELANFLLRLDDQYHRSFELIIVDQNDDNRIDPVIAPYRDRFPIMHLKSSRGLSLARNAGLSYASGDIVAFPDDDCWYDPDTLHRVEALLREHSDWDGVTGGCTTPTGKLRFLDDKDGFLNKINVWRRAVSVSIFLRRSVVASVGEFDENLGAGATAGFCSAEETDYLLRALERGFRIYYNSRLAVNHPDTDTSQDKTSITKSYSYARGLGFVLKRHKYPVWYVSTVLCRSFAGIVLSLAMLDLTKARYYYFILKGRLSGWYEGS